MLCSEAEHNSKTHNFMVIKSSAVIFLLEKSFKFSYPRDHIFIYSFEKNTYWGPTMFKEMH